MTSPFDTPPNTFRTAFDPATDAPAAPSRPVEHALPLRFTGDGGDYLGIWLVNMLLMVVTLGLYYPWAKVRKMRYFYRHTELAGHPFDFHATPTQMLRGALLMTLLFIAYAVADNASPMASVVAAVSFALLWPMLLRASMQFRMAQTSWRGLRFAFVGSLWGAYKVYLVPMLVGGLITGIMMFGVTGLATLARDSAHKPGLVAPLVLIVAAYVVAMMAIGVQVLWRLKAYQHNHYALGSRQSRFQATLPQFVQVFVRSALRMALIGLAGLAVVGVIGAIAWVAAPSGPKAVVQAMVVATPLLFIGLFVLQLAYRAHITAGLHNTIWSSTSQADVRFHSNLQPWALTRRMLLNAVLMLLTGGLYWPFAIIAITRMKLEAITVYTRVHPDDLVVQARTRYNDATGDMAGDFLGVEVGL